MTAGPLWAVMHSQPRYRPAALAVADIPTEPGVYAWYRDGVAIYVGKADSLRDRVGRRHLGRGPVMTGSAFRRNVAQHLGIAAANDIKTKTYVPSEDEVRAVRAFIEGCSVTWLVTATKAQAADLEYRMKHEWMPPLTKQ